MLTSNHRIKFIKAYFLKYESHPTKSFLLLGTPYPPSHINYCISLAFNFWLFVVFWFRFVLIFSSLFEKHEMCVFLLCDPRLII